MVIFDDQNNLYVTPMDVRVRIVRLENKVTLLSGEDDLEIKALVIAGSDAHIIDHAVIEGDIFEYLKRKYITNTNKNIYIFPIFTDYKYTGKYTLRIERGGKWITKYTDGGTDRLYFSYELTSTYAEHLAFVRQLMPTLDMIDSLRLVNTYCKGSTSIMKYDPKTLEQEYIPLYRISKDEVDKFTEQITF